MLEVIRLKTDDNKEDEHIFQLNHIHTLTSTGLPTVEPFTAMKDLRHVHICTLAVDRLGLFFTGTAICLPTDTYSYEYGKKLALKRAISNFVSRQIITNFEHFMPTLTDACGDMIHPELLRRAMFKDLYSRFRKEYHVRQLAEEVAEREAKLKAERQQVAEHYSPCDGF